MSPGEDKVQVSDTTNDAMKILLPVNKYLNICGLIEKLFS